MAPSSASAASSSSASVSKLLSLICGFTKKPSLLHSKPRLKGQSLEIDSIRFEITILDEIV